MNPIKIISYNVNGIRSALSKGWLDWLAQENPDIVCLQEVKAEASQVDLSALDNMGYQHRYWCSAEKKGYSGVAIFSKLAPTDVTYGMGIPQYDAEGRMIRLSFPGFTLINLYAPSGSSGEERQDVKFAWMNDFLPFVQQLNQEKGNLVMCGDFNIAHTEKDIHNPVSNKKSSGFLPEEREWFSRLLDSGLIDAYRYLHPTEQGYSWWTYRFNARKKNLGWRIDYFLLSSALAPNTAACQMLPEAEHSDHCPVSLQLEI